MSATQNKHILVLGGSGFIGRAVISALQSRGHRTSALMRRSSVPDGVKTLTGDIRHFDWYALKKDLPDAIIHLARIPGRHKLSRWIAGYQGRAASSRMLRWLHTLDKPPHLIYISGTLVYGDCGKAPIDESAPLRPIAFQRDYIKAELPMLEALGKNLPVSVARPPWVIGGDSWFRRFYFNSTRTGSVPQFGNGENLMSLIHVNDCAGQICDIASKGEPGRIYNIRACPAITQSRFVSLVAEQVGAGIEILSVEFLRRKYGKAVMEALTFSLDTASREPLIRDFPNQYPDTRSAVQAAIADCRSSDQRDTVKS
jgi:nucleoside-diphosphate-sugar epimerase